MPTSAPRLVSPVSLSVHFLYGLLMLHPYRCTIESRQSQYGRRVYRYIRSEGRFVHEVGGRIPVDCQL